MYGENPSFYLWLRLITREKDYNLYAHFYDTAVADSAHLRVSEQEDAT